MFQQVVVSPTIAAAQEEGLPERNVRTDDLEETGHRMTWR